MSHNEDTPAGGLPQALQQGDPDQVSTPADEEDMVDEEIQDFRNFAASLSSKKSNISKQTIRRGEKDFEAHGTQLQENVLESSRNAMHDVLTYTRIHKPHSMLQGYYFPEQWSMEESEDESGYFKRDRAVALESERGPMISTTGRVIKGTKKGVPGWNKTWLLPEEALFLVERGDLQLWWPRREIHEVFPPEKEDKEDDDDSELGQAYRSDVPLSLQAAYALFVGNEDERGKISLEKYQVYNNLRRQGYVVFRASSSTDSEPVVTKPTPPPSPTLWQWLLSLLRPSSPENTIERQLPMGPLVQPGLYRSYKPIFDSLELIPRYKPTRTPNMASPPQDPFKVAFHVYRSTNAKTNPGPPDFRIAVVSTQKSCVPTLPEISSLLDSTPWNPPTEKSGVEGKGIGPTYQRLKRGRRNVIVAVVDRGFITYLDFKEAAFGEEKLYEINSTKGRQKTGGRGGKGGRRSNGGKRGG